MKHNVLRLIMASALVCAQGCGSQSSAETDCEEFVRLINNVRYEKGYPPVKASTDKCAQWLETTSTRCQQVFSDLAQCSRIFESAPQLEQGECASQLVETATVCVLPSEFQEE